MAYSLNKKLVYGFRWCFSVLHSSYNYLILNKVVINKQKNAYPELQNKKSVFLTYIVFAHLKFSPGIKLLQAFDCLLSVHHGSHSWALLWGDKKREMPKIKHHARAALALTDLCGIRLQGSLCFAQHICWFWGS